MSSHHSEQKRNRIGSFPPLVFPISAGDDIMVDARALLLKFCRRICDWVATVVVVS